MSWLFVLPPLYNLYKLFLLWWLLRVKDFSSWLKKHLQMKRCIFCKCHAHLGHFHWEHPPKKWRTILLEPNVRKAFQVVKSMKLVSLFFKFSKAFCIALKFVYNIDALIFVVSLLSQMVVTRVTIANSNTFPTFQMDSILSSKR